MFVWRSRGSHDDWKGRNLFQPLMVLWRNLQKEKPFKTLLMIPSIKEGFCHSFVLQSVLLRVVVTLSIEGV
jgi:hypothetical protein